MLATGGADRSDATGPIAAQDGGTEEQMGWDPAGRARRPGAPGRDDVARRAGWLARPDSAAARRRHAGRDPRVRRAAHRRADLVQGTRRGRFDRASPVLRAARPGALRPAAAGVRTPGCGAGPPTSVDRDRADRVPDQARADRQRGRARHAGVGRGPCSARARATGIGVEAPRGRRRADAPADRRWRPRRRSS